jgi:hypothetical protein
MDKKKELVDLTPQNSVYAKKIAEARGVPHPVGGAPMPKMPNFAEAQQAGDRHSGVQNTQQRRAQGMATLLTPEERQKLEQQGKAIPGIGSAYYHNQPGAKQLDQQTAPQYQNPVRPEGGLSAQTAEQLAAVAKANAPTAAPAQPAEEPGEDDDFFNYDEFGKRVKDLLANKERRDSIESRCEPMDLMDLIINKEIRQVVPIVPGKYYPTFRTMGGDEDLEVKRLLSSERGSSTYVLSKMTLMNLTCGLYALNGKVLASHQDKDGDFSKEAFDVKFKSITKYPMQVLTDLAINYTWFDERTKKLTVIENIKDF